LALGAWRLAFVPYVSVSSPGVIVQNPISRRTVPYSDIAEVRTGYYGLVLRLKSGQAVICWAIQKSNVAKLGRVFTRGDEVADAIRAYMTNGTGG
jgi:Bacterial PH domain